MKHKIILLIGPSGSGKTTLANYLRDCYGWKVLDSYTTRPRRYPEETGHTFVSDDEFEQLRDMVAYTEFDGHRYCATAAQIDEADLYIVDLEGVKTMQELYHGDTVLLPVYLDVNSYNCLRRMRKRGDSLDASFRRRENDAKAFDGAKEYLNTHFDSVLILKNNSDDDDQFFAVGDRIWKWATI